MSTSAEPTSPQESKRTKVAILGGGAGALAAAFELTRTPERRARVDVTLHQVGWRLGGKAASGRNPDAAHRIEEPGTITWMGAYENAFRVMRACYDELGRPETAPLSTWQQAFRPRSSAVVFCRLTDESAPDDGWFPWTFTFPANGGSPGEAGDIPSPWALFRLGIEWLWSLWGTAEEVAAFRIRPGSTADALLDIEVPAWIETALARIQTATSFEPLEHPLIGAGIPRNDAPETKSTTGVGQLVTWIRNVVRSLPADPAKHDAASQHLLTWLLRRLMEVAWARMQAFVGSEQWAYKLWVSINLAAAMAAGFLTDGVLFHGWQSIEHQDFRAWLRGHGANDVTLESGPLRALYDALFAYVNGDPEKGNLGAGTCLSGLLRMMLTYQGAMFWEAQAGSGDVVFAPLYEVLAKRGVKIELFHRVAALHLTADKKAIASIDIVKQVQLKGDYAPLVDVGGLPTWPSAPRYELIEDGEGLRASGVDLESPYSPPWKDARPLTLTAGEDFDVVILGISLGAVPYVAPELIMADRRFSSMVANVGTVQTLAFQLWQDCDLAELGWTAPRGHTEVPFVTAYVAPTGNWADRSHMVAREDWQSGGAPRNMACFSGALEQLGPTPPFLDSGFAARQKARVQSIARKFLENDVGRLWPLATKSSGHGFRWEHVVSQYYRANIDPSDRYVLSVAGSASHRLSAGDSGFANLVLAGDWVRTSLNAGCLEAAFESGLLAAAAVLGEPVRVFGSETGNG